MVSLSFYPICENDRQLLPFCLIEHRQNYSGKQQQEQSKSEKRNQRPPGP